MSEEYNLEIKTREVSCPEEKNYDNTAEEVRLTHPPATPIGRPPAPGMGTPPAPRYSTGKEVSSSQGMANSEEVIEEFLK